jgi:uncharacterized iron-regulated membrane protein
MKLKSILYLTHRWLGIGMCLLFALWFASGIIMMYVDYPELTEEERLINLPDLNTSEILLSAFEASASIDAGKVFSAVKLTTVLDRPAYQFQAIGGELAIVFADSGELITELSPESAIAAARQSAFAAEGAEPSYDKLVDLDQWSISAGLNRFRPLHRVKLNDPAGSVLYVSNSTGQIVLDTHRNERFWNWLGSIVHWIYPLQLRKNASLWTQVIIYISIIGIVSVFTGGIIGFMRIRIRKLYRGINLSPYTGWMKWHHILGLLTLIFVSTFIFSGLMSMGPWGIFNSSTSAQPQISRYMGGNTLRLSNLQPPDFAAITEPVKEVEWQKIQSTPYYSFKKSQRRGEVQFPGTSTQNQSLLLLAKIGEAIPVLLPDARLLSLDLVQEPDNYYYARHNNYRPFPVYRAKFDDKESSWYHIDLTSGEIVNRVTDASRRERWLFNGLHSLDFQFLLQHRPLWDLLVIILSLLGLGFSLTAVVIGWRRLVD